MQRITIEKKIFLESRLVNKNYKDHIVEKIRGQFSDQCDNSYGYIVKIYPEIEIISNNVSTVTPGVFFDVRFDVKTLKPEVGSVYEGKVCLILQTGIFVEVSGKIKIMIPANKMGSFKYQKDTNSFKSGSKIISQDDMVKVVIDMYRYEKKNFSCIGTLKDFKDLQAK